MKKHIAFASLVGLFVSHVSAADRAAAVAIIAVSLLPIMWSHRQGAEVVKLLATPVIGGKFQADGR